VISLLNSLKESRKASKEKNKIYVNTAPEEEILSADDWVLLLSESKCLTFQKKDVIVHEGEWSARIHQIAKGSCNVQKQGQVLGMMSNGELFGEISFLRGVKTTASVVAAEDNTEIYIIEGAALAVLFHRQPALSGRFYRYLAQILSHRLKIRESSITLSLNN